MCRVVQYLYAAYVRNAKFMSPTTLPFVELMQRSMVEIGRIDVSLTYRYMFVYIRQMAIHLRNAITVQKKVCSDGLQCGAYFESLKNLGLMNFKILSFLFADLSSVGFGFLFYFCGFSFV